MNKIIVLEICRGKVDELRNGMLYTLEREVIFGGNKDLEGMVI